MSTKTSPLLVNIKKEVTSDEIKDFAETAMNELLGWYGYGNVDKNDIRSNYNNNQNTLNAIVDTDALAPNNTANKRRKNTVQRIKLQDTSALNRSSPESLSEDSIHSNQHENADNKQDDDECGWCKRPVSLGVPEFLGTPDGPRYCSESCFAQSRRASFKRSKTCDWCKHVRHTVSYVDFQDGASQLQFCSDRCLNQFKMQIFCKETQAHLDMNPHLKEKGLTNNAALITPDLWLKNCRSRSVSPTSDLSRTSPIRDSPNPIQSTDSLHKPLISVTPASKLMPKSMDTQSTRISARNVKRRRSLRLCAALTNSKSLNQHENDHQQSKNGPTNDLVSNKFTDTLSKPKQNPEPLNLRPNSPHLFLPPPPNLYPIRPGNMHPPRFIMQHRPTATATLVPNQRIRSSPPTHTTPPMQMPNPQISTQPSVHLHQNPRPQIPLSQHLQSTNFLGATAPPVTILVPYPIILPIPIPIPIPIPMPELIRAAQFKLDFEKKTATSQDNVPSVTNTNSNEEPLDFTKSKSTNQSTSDDSSQINEAKQSSNNKNTTDTNDKDVFVIENDHKNNITTIQNEETDSITQNTTKATESNRSATNSLIEAAEPKVPKLKITRLHTKRTIGMANDPGSSVSVTATFVPPRSEVSSDNSRPLRKRKRIVDCDYSKSGR